MKRGVIFSLLIVSYLVYTGIIYLSLPQESKDTHLYVREGKQVWQKYNCSSCHQIYGLGGYLGPDLTNTYSQKGPAYIKAFLISGTNIMPDFKMSKQEMQVIIAYLQDIDKSGIADPKAFKLNRDGTIEQ